MRTIKDIQNVLIDELYLEGSEGLAKAIIKHNCLAGKIRAQDIKGNPVEYLLIDLERKMPEDYNEYKNILKQSFIEFANYFRNNTNH